MFATFTSYRDESPIDFNPAMIVCVSVTPMGHTVITSVDNERQVVIESRETVQERCLNAVADRAQAEAEGATR